MTGGAFDWHERLLQMIIIAKRVPFHGDAFFLSLNASYYVCMTIKLSIGVFIALK